MKKTAFFFILLSFMLMGCQHTELPDFVYVQDDHFVMDGKTWFPLMLNYKVLVVNHGDSVEVLPADFYLSKDMAADFQQIADMGFNSLRICMDSIPDNCHSEALYQATEHILLLAKQCQLKVMLLIRKPLDDYWMNYTEGLLKHFANNSTLWAYDFFNEPLYFDPVPDRDKTDAYRIVCQWRDMMRQYAPHQLFTIGFAEPIEVFEWDPVFLPVDFVEIHTYHPLRVASEMRWYSDNCKKKPWMVGETSLPADNDKVSYEEQRKFMLQVYALARQYHAAGFGWWNFQDCPNGYNFEAQHTGLINPLGEKKLAVQEVRKLESMTIAPDDHQVPPNYYNMLGYNNIVLKGKVINARTHRPIHGAVVRGWTKDWIGMNTYTDKQGNFTLYSNDFNIHFEVSAPGMNTVKFDKEDIPYYFTDPQSARSYNFDSLPNRYLEYHSIDYHNFLEGDTITLKFNPKHFNQSKIEGNLGKIKLKKLKVDN